MNQAELKQNFVTIFETAPTAEYFAPGRINLIGEHTDYNGGHVFPCAITLGTYALVKPRTDQKLRFYSANFPKLGVIEVALDQLAYKKSDDWANYPKGVIKFLQEAGHLIDHGLDLYFYGNIPNGAGLSSSASIELLMGVTLEHEFTLKVTRLELIKIGQKVENDFIGVNSGIMDQFAVGMGQKEQAILLDTNTLAYEMVPIELQNYVIIIMNTQKRRELADSKYNERRSQCEEALRRLQTKLEIKSLGELSAEEFDRHTYLIEDETLIKRARHAVWENQRTLQAKEALTSGNLSAFGQLINASHVSLQYDYEVTGRELDTLVQAAWQQVGILGARMTGAGFGGCAIALVERDCVADFTREVGKIYQEKIGYPAAFYVAEVADGAKKIVL